MNSNNQPLKLTAAAEDFARQVFPIAKQFVTDQVAARQNRTQQQPQLQRPRQSIIAKAAGCLNRFLHPPIRPNDYQADPYQQQPSRQNHQNYQNQIPQGREQEIRECLKAHNEARRSAPGRARPALKWDERLATHAQRWAAHLIRHDTFEHDTSGTGEGENLFMVWGAGARRCTLKQAVEAWNAEGVHYRGERVGQGDMGKWGHYTQNVWPTTTHVGMARAVGGRGRQVIVARYSPPGNVVGRSAFE